MAGQETDAEVARRRELEEQAALERLYGPKRAAAKGQSWTGVVLLVLGAGLLAWGAAADGDVRLIAVGVVGLAVGVWSFFDGLARARKRGGDGGHAPRS